MSGVRLELGGVSVCYFSLGLVNSKKELERAGERNTGFVTVLLVSMKRPDKFRKSETRASDKFET